MSAQAGAYLDVLKLRPKGGPVIDVLGGLKRGSSSPADRAALMRRMRAVEAERQDIYLKTLKERGQFVRWPDGSASIRSYADAPVFLPNVLKHRPLSEWTPLQRIWVNV